MKSVVLKTIVIIGFVQMITVNALANILPINNKTTGEISDQYANLFTPSGSTFAIWGLIYSLLLGFSVAILFKSNFEKFPKKALYLFIANSILNSCWIFVWHHEMIVLSLGVMLFLLLTLIRLNIVLNSLELSLIQAVFLRLPFTVYFGWITVATIANFTAYFSTYDMPFYGLSEPLWTIIILSVGVAIGLSQLWIFKKGAYALVLIWAYFGIYSKHLSESGFNSNYPEIIVTTQIAMGVFSLVLLGILIKITLTSQNHNNESFF